jgi:hypothetical protein
MNDLQLCRTAALGGHIEVCKACGVPRPGDNPCRNRHCSECHGAAQAGWAEPRAADLLPVAYFHVVFMPPAADLPIHELIGGLGQHFAHEIGVCTLFYQIQKRHFVIGHESEAPVAGVTTAAFTRFAPSRPGKGGRADVDRSARPSCSPAIHHRQYTMPRDATLISDGSMRIAEALSVGASGT